MWGGSNYTLQCYNQECKHYGKVFSIPTVPLKQVESHERETIRHALTHIGVLYPGEEVSETDLKFCKEVLARYIRDNKIEHVFEVRPAWFSDELAPYYDVTPRA